MKHKHYDLIVAWANGAAIECRINATAPWVTTTHPSWLIDMEYRIKLTPKTPGQLFYEVRGGCWDGLSMASKAECEHYAKEFIRLMKEHGQA